MKYLKLIIIILIFLVISYMKSKYKTNKLEKKLQTIKKYLNKGGSLIKENYSTNIEPIDNIDFDNLITLEGILDFSEKNPFGEIGA